MANQYFYKVSAAPIDDLTVSNNLRVAGTTMSGSITKTLVIPTATSDPSSEADIIKITPQQSGTTFILDQSLSADGHFDQVLVLPPASVGLNYTFICRKTGGSSGKISIMPYGYTYADGNPAGSGNGVAEAYIDSIQVIITIGETSGGYTNGSSDFSYQINSAEGSVAEGGVMFTSNMGAAAMLKLTCVSTSITGSVKTGACRWVGVGQVAVTRDIDLSS